MKRGRRASSVRRAVPPPRRSRATLRPWLVALLALSLAWGGYRLMRSRQADHTRRAAAADSVNALDPAMAYQRGVELSKTGRVTDALPYLRRAALAPPARWEYQAVYGTALSNASLEQAGHRGFGGPRTRSSWERTRLALESLAYLARAESLATEQMDRDRIARRRAVLLSNWGFTREAESELAKP